MGGRNWGHLTGKVLCRRCFIRFRETGFLQRAPLADDADASNEGSEADLRSAPSDRCQGLSFRKSGVGLKKGGPKEERGGNYVCMYVYVYGCMYVC